MQARAPPTMLLGGMTGGMTEDYDEEPVAQATEPASSSKIAPPGGMTQISVDA